MILSITEFSSLYMMVEIICPGLDSVWMLGKIHKADCHECSIDNHVGLSALSETWWALYYSADWQRWEISSKKTKKIQVLPVNWVVLLRDKSNDDINCKATA